MSDKLVTKNHSMSIGFDAPEDPATVLNVNAWIVGKKFAQVDKYMKSTYTEVAFDAFADEESGNKSSEGSKEPQYWELKLKMVDQASAKAAVDVINNFFDEIQKINGEGSEKLLPFIPKAHTLGKNVFIGMHVIIPKNDELDWLKVPEDLI